MSQPASSPRTEPGPAARQERRGAPRRRAPSLPKVVGLGPEQSVRLWQAWGSTVKNLKRRIRRASQANPGHRFRPQTVSFEVPTRPRPSTPVLMTSTLTPTPIASGPQQSIRLWQAWGSTVKHLKRRIGAASQWAWPAEDLNRPNNQPDTGELVLPTSARRDHAVVCSQPEIFSPKEC